MSCVVLRRALDLKKCVVRRCASENFVDDHTLSDMCRVFSVVFHVMYYYFFRCIMAGKNISGAGSSPRIPITNNCDHAYAMYLAEMKKIETRGFVPTLFLFF
jgi:hypothetical protein